MSNHYDSSEEPDSSDVESVTPKPSNLLILTEDHCRYLSGDRVCGNLAPCARNGHKNPDAARGVPGGYFNKGKARRNAPCEDGDATISVIPMEQVEADEEARALEHLEENTAMGGDPALQEAYLLSPLRTAEEGDSKPTAKPDPTSPKAAPHSENDGIPASIVKQTNSVVNRIRDATQSVLGAPTAIGATKRGKGSGAPRLEQARAKKAEEVRKLADIRAKIEAEEALGRMETARLTEEARMQQDQDLRAEQEAMELEAEIRRMEEEKALLQDRYDALRHQRLNPQPSTASSTSARINHNVRFAPIVGQGTNRPQAALPLVPRPGYDLAEAPPAPAPLHIPGGQDPDVDTDTVFGEHKSLAHEVFEQLIPHATHEDLKEELQTLLPDVVAPSLGTSTTDAAGGQEEMTSGFLNALENHTHALHGRRGGFVKSDASWNTLGRVALVKVKTHGDFDKLMYVFNKREREFPQRFSSRVRALLHYHGYSDQDARTFAESSRYSNLCLTAHSLYGRLLSHIQSEIHLSDFKTVKPLIDMVSMDLVSFREDVSRLHMWINTYVYLRNMYHRSYWTIEHQKLLNRARIEGTSTPKSEESNPNPKCNHCQGHPKGTKCPLTSIKTRNQARKIAKEARAQGGNFNKAVKRILEEREDGRDGEAEEDP